MPTLFDREVSRPEAQRSVETDRLMRRAAELTVRIQTLRDQARTLTAERDEILVRVDGLKGRA